MQNNEKPYLSHQIIIFTVAQRYDVLIYFMLSLIFLSTLIMIAITSSQNLHIASQQAFAESPTFGRQTILDDSSDWLDVWRGENTHSGSDYIDIEAANYYSDGKTLNATLWLPSFKEIPTIGKKVNYGSRTLEGGVPLDRRILGFRSWR